MPPSTGGGRGQIAQALADFPKRTRAIYLRNLKDAQRRFEGEARRLVDRPGPPASRPGEPPRRRTGRLQRGIVGDIDEARLTLTFRSTAPYSQVLEKGGRNMAARPFMSVAWQRVKRDIAAIMGRRK